MALFGRTPKNQAPKDKSTDMDFLRTFSGMRVEVLGGQQVLFFVAVLFISNTGNVELRQMSRLSPGFERILANWAETIRRTTAGQSGKIDPATTPIPVHLRGYNAEQNKAVHFSGGIRHMDGSVWRVERLKHERTSNDRAFFRQKTNASGTATLMAQVGQVLAPGSGMTTQCEIHNISAGGVCIRTRMQYPLGSILVLRFQLLPEQTLPPMRCQVLRRTPGSFIGYEYGCKFMQLDQPMEEHLAQAILELQQRKRQK